MYNSIKVDASAIINMDYLSQKTNVNNSISVKLTYQEKL